MTNNEVAQAFARGETHGKANSMFIESAGNGRVIYSYGYHFPIALIKDGACFFNTDKYSRTTSKHQTEVRRAIYGVVLHGVDTVNLQAMI